MEQIELPGGNDETLRILKQEYIALALKLKERKEALGMAPGIESEIEIDADRKEFALNSANMGLYDNENTGITGGKESSLYRAQMLNIDSDKDKIQKDKDTSEKRVNIGATVAGVGAVGGLVVNTIINNDKDDDLKKVDFDSRDSMVQALKKKLSKSGMSNLNSVDWSSVDMDSLRTTLRNINFENINLNNYDARSYSGASGFTKLQSLLLQQ